MDFRRKQNGFLMGETILNQPEGFVNEEVDTLDKAEKWNKILWQKSKFRPDMDANEKVFIVNKAKQPLVWLNIRNNVLPPESVGSTKLEPGVFCLWDDGLCYPGVQKPYFREFFLDMQHFKGRMVERLIGVRKEWEEKPESEMVWEAWFNMKDQTPYLLTERARTKKDYVPEEGEKAVPPEWESKIKTEHQWWAKGLSPNERLKRLELAYNDLIEKGVLKSKVISAEEGQVNE